MAKKEPTIIHPLHATEALQGYHSDVTILLSAVQTTVSLLEDGGNISDKSRQVMARSLNEALNRVTRWYQMD